MKTFLVPVDFSPVTEEVIDNAIDFARAFAGKVMLLHVVQPPVVATTEYALPVEIIQEALDVSEKSAKQKMAALAEKFGKAGLKCESKVLTGPPVTHILDEAARLGADYIIMGSHGHGRLYDFLVGSTASGVIKKALCGVIMLPPEDKNG
jgi:nucleotide-binding universal stress UspA family protein